MKKYVVGLLFGVFLLFGGMDVHALEINQVIDGVNSKQFSEDFLQTINAFNIQISAEYRCDSSVSTCDDTTAQQFGLTFTSSGNSQVSSSAVTFNFTDEYILYTTNSTDYESASLSDEMFAMLGMMGIMDTIAKQQNLAIPYDRNLDGIVFQYATDGYEHEEYTYTSEDGKSTVSGTKNAKINYRDGFASALEKMNSAPIRGDGSEDEPGSVIPGQDDENDVKDLNDANDNLSSTPKDAQSDSPKIVNPSTGDLNLLVVATLGIAATLGVSVSFKKMHG